MWSFCESILDESGQAIAKDEHSEELFAFQNLKYAKAGERVLGFAVQHLNEEEFPEGF